MKVIVIAEQVRLNKKPLRPGSLVELPDVLARRWISLGIAQGEEAEAAIRVPAAEEKARKAPRGSKTADVKPAEIR